MNCKKIRLQLKNRLAVIKKAYDSNSCADEWLKDNYYLFVRGGKNLSLYWKSRSKSRVSPFCSSLFEKGYSVFTRQADRDISKTALLLAQENLGVLYSREASAVLETVLIFYAAELIKNKQSVEKSVCELLKLRDIDFLSLGEEKNENEILLLKDKVYAQMTPESKNAYKKRIYVLSKLRKTDEKQIIESALSSGRHIGFSFFREKTDKNASFVIIELLLALALSLTVCALTGNLFLFFVLFIPIIKITDIFISFIQMKKNPPEEVLRLGNDKIPDDGKTLITVSLLLPAASKSSLIKRKLLNLYASNRDDNIFYCLLVDKKGFSSEEKPDDEANTRALERIIKDLNTEYPDRFFLFIRGREYSKTGKEFIGRNRKMGAYSSLVKLITGVCNEFETVRGNRDILPSLKYILALDEDTVLPFQTAKKLILTALHPLNKAVFDPEKKIIKSGYGIFCPVVDNRLFSKDDTFFSLLMTGTSGSVAYDELTSDRYQDVFGSAVFSGKGLIDIEAYSKTVCDRFRDERILSHDIIEGEFLRTLLVSDAKIQDSFPKNESEFLTRLHRWIRGDWQNIPFLSFHPSILKDREKNPLGIVSKFKISENIRRSLNEIFCLIILLLSAFLEPKARIIALAVFVLDLAGEYIFALIRTVLSGGFALLSRLYYSNAVPSTLKCISDAFITFITLARTAAVSSDAIFRSCIRLFSKKNLLEWTTSADYSGRNNFLRIVLNNWFSVLCAAFLLCFYSPFSALCAITLFSNIIFEYLSSKPLKEKSEKLDALARENIISHAAAQWKYYENYAGREENYLPADNVQFSPVFRVAHRTSPTNIGLLLCCVVAARRLEFISENEALERIKNTLSSVERLEKWNGNLYNWYDTLSLKPLEPKFVSTVDCGNYLCCLVAVKEFLKTCANKTESEPLEKKIEEIIKESNLSLLYNKKRHLFHIGFDVEKQALTGSFYDLLMSEARMTGYFAVCKCIASKKHWGALSRPLGKTDRHAGPLSWSGTFFEYFMPDIFLPAKKNTFSYEGLKYCLHCQFLYAKKKRIPFGVSESAFYAFDENYNYQYKAHGINNLRLSYGNSPDTVISPYSTYLALPFSPVKAAENIKKLEKLHLRGPFALYEAADFTKDRIENGEYRIIKSYMAHHIGMSLVSIVNAVDDMYFQRLFMSDLDMAGGRSLLEETAPANAPVIKRRNEHSPKQKDERRERFIKSSSSSDFLSPKASGYSNGETSLFVCDNGASLITYNGKNIFRHSRDFLFNPHCFSAVFRTKNERKFFTPLLNGKSGEGYKCFFKNESAVFKYEDEKIRLSQEMSVHKYLPVQKITLTLQNPTKKKINGEVIIYFEPCLTKSESEDAHPAFSHLFITGEFDKKDKIISFNRRESNMGEEMSLSCAFKENVPFSVCLDREKALERTKSLYSLGERESDFSRERLSADYCSYMSVKVSLNEKEKKSLTLLICVGKDARTTKRNIFELKTNPRLLNENARSLFNEGTLTSVISSEILPKILFDCEITEKMKKAIEKNSGSVELLWRNGISGDNPIILFNYRSAENSAELERIIKLHRVLTNASVKNDLVIVYPDESQRQVTEKIIRDCCSSKTNIFLIENSIKNEETLNFLEAFCVYETDGTIEETKTSSFEPVPILTAEKTDAENFLSDGKYSINRSPVIPWSFVYSNDCFGTLVSDRALGFTYSENSALNKLSGWTNDTMRDLNTERLLLFSGARYYDIINNCNVVFSEEKAEYSCTADGIALRTVVSVSEDERKKNITVFCENKSDLKKEIKLVYSAEPFLSGDGKNRKMIKFRKGERSVFAENPLNRDYKGTLEISLLQDADIFLSDKTKLLSGDWTDSVSPCSSYPAAAIGKNITLEKGEKRTLNFCLSYKCEELFKNIEVKNRIEINSPDVLLNALVNRFLPIQIIRGRLQAKSGFYQCSGAYGFRDQLQDALSLILLCPERLKNQIITNCKAQFPEGDVMHWFFVLPSGKTRGVRTRYSDDLLWLPLAVSEYVKATGEKSFLETEIPFLSGEPLKENESERYFETEQSEKKASILEHCRLAVEKSLKFGVHSLPLIMGGDWNDGYNLVGKNGRGESVWLGEFLIIVLKEFCRICADDDRQRYLKIIEELKKNIDLQAWNGKWYTRAFNDFGEALGHPDNEECRIDSLSQSFAVFASLEAREKINSALESAEKFLVDKKHGIIKLFDSGFKNDKNVGYISSYPIGLRENAGQYTHSAVWLAAAFIKAGYPSKGYELLKMINPLYKYENKETAEKYMTEPYFLAGDVYSRKNLEGRGGWTVYTGSAGWYYKTVTELIFGLTITENCLFIKPSFPDSWDSAELKLKYNEASIEIRYERSDCDALFVDGEKKLFVELNSKNHKIIVKYSGKK